MEKKEQAVAQDHPPLKYEPKEKETGNGSTKPSSSSPGFKEELHELAQRLFVSWKDSFDAL
ncbi:hypothetical protein E2320_012629 [Naja naja]|nr:hypothetical protein E2320_012629 [Naja naja]